MAAKKRKVTTKKPAKHAFVLSGKDPDISPEGQIDRWMLWSDYYEAHCVVDPKTGKGTVQLKKPRGWR